MARDIVSGEQITAILAEALEAPSIDLRRQKMSPLVTKILQLRGNIEAQQTRITDFQDIIKKYQNAGLSRKSAITQGYKEGKITLNITNEEQVLMNLILEGYETVVKVREILTKQVITYQVAAGGKKTGKIMELSTTLNDLLPYLYIEYRSDGYSIRIRTTQKNLREIYTNRQIEAGVAVEEIETFVPTASSLYSATYRYFTDERLKQKGNWGNLYEAYRSLLARSKNGNDWIPDTKTIADAFAMVLAGGGKSGGFGTGGDVMLEQDKGGIGSRPTLTSITTVLNTLTDLANALQEFINSSSVDTLVSMLTQKRVGVEMFDMVQEEATEAIREALLGISGATTT